MVITVILCAGDLELFQRGSDNRDASVTAVQKVADAMGISLMDAAEGICKIVNYEDQWHDISIYDRKKLHQGLLVPGPAIIGEMDSTTVVLPGFDARVDAIGNLILHRQSFAQKRYY